LPSWLRHSCSERLSYLMLKRVEVDPNRRTVSSWGAPGFTASPISARLSGRSPFERTRSRPPHRADRCRTSVCFDSARLFGRRLLVRRLISRRSVESVGIQDVILDGLSKLIFSLSIIGGLYGVLVTFRSVRSSGASPRRLFWRLRSYPRR
jgi:hypothetical protein